MTYGVDQCRVCGRKIPPDPRVTLEDWQRAQRRQFMPEKEWRRRGYLAAPTPAQVGAPWIGCCQACGAKEWKKRFRPNVIIVAVLVTGLVAIFVVWWLVTYAPYNGPGPAHPGG